MTYFWPGSVVEIGGLYASMQRVAQLTKFLQPLNLAIFTTWGLSLFNILTVPAPHLLSLFLEPIISSLKITDRSFRYASPRLWNQPPDSFR